MERFPTLSSSPSAPPPFSPQRSPNEGITINVDLIEKPILKTYFNESPEDPDPTKRKAFYDHKCHFFIFTAAGKPIFTRYSDEYNVASLCASYAAIVPKLQYMYSDQSEAVTTGNTIRYIKTKDLLIVFMFKRNFIYLCLSKGSRGYTSIYRQLEYLHIQVLLFIYQKDSLYQ